MVSNPLGLDLHDATGYAPRHGVYDAAHLAELTASMTASGWDGPPVVARTEWAQAITGSHRIPAARAAGIDVPAVDVFDLAEAARIDLDELIDAHGTLEDALPAFCQQVPAGIAEAYGLDIE